MTEQGQVCLSPSDEGVVHALDDCVAAVRRRPQMYLGDSGGQGLERLVTTAVRRLLESSDKAEGVIRVQLHEDGSVTVADVDGRSTPVGLAELMAFGTGEAPEPRPDAGAPLVVLNALSERFQLEQWVNGTPERRCFRRGRPHRGRPRRIRGMDGATLIHFRPDSDVLGHTSLPFDTVADALEGLAQRPGVGNIFLEDDRSGRRRQIRA